jgi:hypothetical protein
MPLKSVWFAGNERLERCLRSDPQHVKIGDEGIDVLLIQGALRVLDGVRVDDREVARGHYGRSTAAGVLGYKRRRNIVNHSYQTTPDDVVGRQTIESLDGEMLNKQRALSMSAVGIPFVRSFLFAPVTQRTVKCVVVTETNSPWFQWAKQFERKFKPVGMGDVVSIPNGSSVDSVVEALKMAAALAGPRGFLVISVGHGGGSRSRERRDLRSRTASRVARGRAEFMDRRSAPADECIAARFARTGQYFL